MPRGASWIGKSDSDRFRSEYFQKNPAPTNPNSVNAEIRNFRKKLDRIRNVHGTSEISEISDPKYSKMFRTHSDPIIPIYS